MQKVCGLALLTGTHIVGCTYAIVPLLQAFLYCESPGLQHDSGSFWLQDRVRELESEIEWVRAERQDAQQAAQREQKQAQARIKEAEDAAARAKAARRLASPEICIHSSCVGWLWAQWLAEAAWNCCLGAMPCSATQTSIFCPVTSVGVSVSSECVVAFCKNECAKVLKSVLTE